MILFLIVATSVAAIYVVYNVYTEDILGYEDSAELEPSSSCNVYALNLHGMLDAYEPPEGSENYGYVTGSDVLVYNIEEAAKDPTIKGVLIDIDSTGGYAVPAEEVNKALKILNKPSVAVIRGYGDSAAYWAATGADLIIASPLSDVGSIGITSSYLDNTK